MISVALVRQPVLLHMSVGSGAARLARCHRELSKLDTGIEIGVMSIREKMDEEEYLRTQKTAKPAWNEGKPRRQRAA